MKTRALVTTLLLLVTVLTQAAPRTIHVFVALCDNVNQGIVKVPEAIGNGQDPKNNLYWGCGYGVKTYFGNSADWTVVKKLGKQGTYILDRILFKHKTTNTYLLADAYDGAYIKQCTIDLLNACAGNFTCNIIADTLNLQFGGASSLLAYTGHNGLMDFQLNEYPTAKNTHKRDVLIFACYSKSYFKDIVRQTGASPKVWSTHLMSAEAYTLKAAVDGWILNETGEQLRTRAAQAYNKYQKCGEKAARNLLVSGY